MASVWFLPREAQPLLEGFVRRVPPGATGLGVDLALRRERATVWAEGPSERFIPTMARSFVELGADEGEMGRLARVGAALDPPMLGYWIESRPGGADAGWFVPGDLAVSLVQDRVGAPGLWDWCRAHGVGELSWWGRSVGSGTGFDALEVPLPGGEDVERSVHTGVQALASVGARRPPDTALAALMNEASRSLYVDLRLAGDGVVRGGLGARNPSRRLMLDVAQASGFESFEELAAAEGVMAVEGPESVVAVVWADGADAVVRYRLA